MHITLVLFRFVGSYIAHKGHSALKCAKKPKRSMHKYCD